MDYKLAVSKNFQLNVTIIEARHLSVSNVDTVAYVSVGSKKKQAKAKTKKTQNPYFNVLFTFLFHLSLNDVLKQCLRLAIHQTTCNRLIGQCDIELTTIWQHLGHQFYHKWAVLVDPRDPLLGMKGYLKCDIELIEEGVAYVITGKTAANSDDIEGNLMVPAGLNFRRQSAAFAFNFYRADGIRFRREKHKKEAQVQCKRLYVKVHFAGRTMKTRVAKGIEPVWEQALGFVEAIPSLFQSIIIELWDKKIGLVGSTTLSLSDLCNEEIGATPSFGPAFIYVYQVYKYNTSISWLSGRILMSITCELLDRGNPIKKKIAPVVTQFDERHFGPYETYTLFLAVFQCTFFQKNYFKKCQISVNHGTWFVPHGKDMEMDNSDVGLRFTNDAIKFETYAKICKPYYAWHCRSILPTAQTSCSWPITDYRERRINRTKNLLTTALEKINRCQRQQYLRKVDVQEVSDVIQAVAKACEKILGFPPYPFETKLDTARLMELRELLRKTIQTANNTLLKEIWPVDETLLMLEAQISEVLAITKDQQPTFPDFEIAISKLPHVKKKTGVVLKTEDVLYSKVEKERGKNCGKLQTIFIENGKGCEVAALDVFVWFGRQRYIPKGLEMLTGSRPDEETGNIDKIEQNEIHLFELRVHVYQGSLCPGLDESGLADPFVRVIAFGQCQETQVKTQTLDPIWDETLSFRSVEIYGDPKVIKRQSSGVIFEVLDFDGDGCIELVGRASARPVVTLQNEAYVPARLSRHTIKRCKEVTGEILLAMELIEMSEESESLNLSKTFTIPEEIRPHLQIYLLEVIFWGVRNYKLASSWCNPRIMGLIECNGVRVESQLVRSATTTNFEYQKHQVQLLLPQEKEYTPPLSIGLYEFSAFNRASYKGGSIIPYVTKYLDETPKYSKRWSLELDFGGDDENEMTIVELDEKPDWWSKYYGSKVLQADKRLTFYRSELELQPEFDGLQEFLQSIELKRGKTYSKKKSQQETIGIMKCHIRLSGFDESEDLTACDSYFRTNPVDITVRVYVVAAFNLTPTDFNGRCDPYIKLSFGKEKISDRKNYIYKETDPIFGRCYELRGTLPKDNTLQIKVMDHDMCMPDDLIGQTFIDIENRFYTKHRASCGLAYRYETTGYCKWRDLMDPTEVLTQVCKMNDLPDPKYTNEYVTIGNYAIKRNGDKRNNIALRILNNFHLLPEHGVTLVPEHIETRNLYHPCKPQIDQGRLEMWVDVFPGHGSLPPAVDITPRQPEKLELRIIVWNTSDVLSSDVNFLTMEESIDVYVLGWLTSNKLSQRTDIHYRSLTGEGAFNWRFIFPFLYSPSDHKMIIYQKVAWSEGLEKEKLPPKLELQVWDNDLLVDDFIGSLTLDLSNMPKGAQSAKSCTLNVLQADQPRVSLFKLKKMRGWWPFKARGSDKDDILAGKVDLELEIMSEEQGRFSPAGLGREGPQSLPEPKRPGTSFFFFGGLNPLGLIKSIVFGNLGRKLLMVAGIGVLVLFVMSGWLAAPGILMKKLLDP